MVNIIIKYQFGAAISTTCFVPGQYSYGVDVVISIVYESQKLRRDQSHTVGHFQSQSSNPGLAGSEIHALLTIPLE